MGEGVGQNRWAPAIIKWLPLLLLLTVGVPLWLVIEVKSLAIDKARALEACQVETIRVYPRDPDKTGDDIVRRFNFRTACMKATGYSFVIVDPGCSFAEDSLQTACYRADGLRSLLEAS
jgi:hypothetical protein